MREDLQRMASNQSCYVALKDLCGVLSTDLSSSAANDFMDIEDSGKLVEEFRTLFRQWVSEKTPENESLLHRISQVQKEPSLQGDTLPSSEHWRDQYLKAAKAVDRLRSETVARSEMVYQEQKEPEEVQQASGSVLRDLHCLSLCSKVSYRHPSM